MDDFDSFEDGIGPGGLPIGESFVVDLDGFEGPIDVLLSLAREHKLDLTRISILALADQYLEFVTKSGGRTWNWPPIIWSWRRGWLI